MYLSLIFFCYVYQKKTLMDLIVPIARSDHLSGIFFERYLILFKYVCLQVLSKLSNLIGQPFLSCC